MPRFKKVEREPPADGVVIEGDDLYEPPERGLLNVIRALAETSGYAAATVIPSASRPR